MPFAIDLFCGAGGFSEGILQSGFDIVFSSDRSPMVQKTYMNRHEQLGLKQGVDTYFELADIRELLSEDIFEKINSLKYGNVFEPGSIDVMFGGPPCQGFSRLGKRDPSDPRNMLFHEYLRIIKDVQPKYVVMENVAAILDMQMLDFPSVLSEDHYYEGQNLIPYILKMELTEIGYQVLDIRVLNAAEYGVPQRRNRAIFLAYRNDVAPIDYPEPTGEAALTVRDALGDLYESEKYSTDFSKSMERGTTVSFKTKKPLERTKITGMEESRHDLAVTQRFALYRQGENKRKALLRLNETGIDLRSEAPELFYETLYQLNSKGNSEIIGKFLDKADYGKNIKRSQLWFNHTNKELSTLAFIEREGVVDESSSGIVALSRRLGISREEAIDFWQGIRKKLNERYDEDRLNELFMAGNINEEMADAVFTKKGIRFRLDMDSVAPTMVTLPDDYIHPFFNRVLTVREMARIQSFDDSFEFLGKRTTGGSMRAKETPQFTQVGNAVPPRLARAVADAAMRALNGESM